MEKKSSSLDDPSVLGRIALAITGAFLLSFYFGFMRFLAGSWREFAALALAALGYLAGQVLLVRLIHPRTVAQWRWVAAMCPFLGGAAGGAYVAVSVTTGAGPIIYGLVLGALHGDLIARHAGKAATGSSALNGQGHR